MARTPISAMTTATSGSRSCFAKDRCKNRMGTSLGPPSRPRPMQNLTANRVSPATAAEKRMRDVWDPHFALDQGKITMRTLLRQGPMQKWTATVPSNPVSLQTRAKSLCDPSFAQDRCKNRMPRLLGPPFRQPYPWIPWRGRNDEGDTQKSKTPPERIP